MNLRRWRAPRTSPELAGILADECGIPLFLAEILIARGVDSPAKTADFLDPPPTLCDPALLPDMEPAVRRIREAAAAGEKVAVYGDYDCDGACAAAILFRYLTRAGIDAVLYIPSRDGDGYGLGNAAIDRLGAEGVTLLVTVDNGVSALAEAAYARSLGMDLIVTDHHQPGDVLPEASAVVDPHRKDCEPPFRLYCGAGVALQLVRALAFPDALPEKLEEEFALLAAVATVGDIVPLTGENRTIVRKGLPLLKKGASLGLSALFEAAGAKKISANTVAFGLAPRLNAAGRMGESSLAAELLLAETKADAEQKAARLDALNASRQRVEGAIFAEALDVLDREPERLREKVLFLTGDNWDAGVVGIVCARLLERFGKPTFLLSLKDGVATGSARGMEGFHVFHALQHCAEALERFGGHAQAGGFTVAEEKIPLFESLLKEYAASREIPGGSFQIDRELAPGEVTAEFAAALAALEPYGAQNPEPLFALRGMRLERVVSLSGGRHAKLLFSREGRALEVLAFGREPERFSPGAGQAFDLLVTMELNEFSGRRSAALRLRDLRPAGLDEAALFDACALAERMLRGELSEPEREVCAVGREDVALVYRALRRLGSFRGGLTLLYFTVFYHKISYTKYSAAVQVLRELGLVSFSERDETLSVRKDPPGVSLSDSPLYRALRQGKPSGSENGE